MYGFQVKNSNGQTILNSENKLAKLKEVINYNVPTRTDGQKLQVNLTNPTSNQIFVTFHTLNYFALIEKYIRNNGQFEGFVFLSNIPAGQNIDFYVYEIEGE